MSLRLFSKILLAASALIAMAGSAFAQPAMPQQYSIPSAQDSVWDAPSGIDPAVRESEIRNMSEVFTSLKGEVLPERKQRQAVAEGSEA